VYALHIRWIVAAAGHVTIAQATFDEAVRQFPNERLTLHHGHSRARPDAQKIRLSPDFRVPDERGAKTEQKFLHRLCHDR
jgi:hypothetical protein